MTEKKWDEVPRQSILANGGAQGQITVPDSTLFRVKQKVFLKSDALQSRELVINRISSTGVLTLAKTGGNIDSFEDLSDFLVSDNTQIWAERQTRATITPNDYERAVYEEEPIMAKRTILVDKRGNRIDENNPLPTSATVSLGDITVETALDAFTKNPSDNAIAVGTDDGTKTGTKKAHKIGVDGKLEVKDTDAKSVLDAINTKLANPMPVSGPLTDAQLRANPVPVSFTGGGDATAANQVIANTILNAINTQLTTGILKVDDDASQILLSNILAQLSSGGLSIGTEDGTPTGTPRVFVNNLRSMIMSSANRVGTITWLDIADKRNRRVDKLEYTSATFPGLTARKQFSYTLVGNEYVRTSPGIWSIV